MGGGEVLLLSGWVGFAFIEAVEVRLLGVFARASVLASQPSFGRGGGFENDVVVQMVFLRFRL